MNTPFIATPSITPLLTRKEVAGMLSIALKTLDNNIAAGEIPVVKIGKSVRIRPAAVEAFITAREGGK